MEKSYICINCRKSLPHGSYEIKVSKNGRPSRARKCKECVVAGRRIRTNSSLEQHFSRLCINQRYAHKKGHRGKDPDGFLITVEDLLQIWDRQEGKCAYSGILMTHHRDGISRVDINASLDRRNPNAGYTLENVHLVCNRVNTMKHTLDEDMFMWWIKNIAEHLLAK